MFLHSLDSGVWSQKYDLFDFKVMQICRVRISCTLKKDSSKSVQADIKNCLDSDCQSSTFIYDPFISETLSAIFRNQEDLVLDLLLES